MKHLTKFFMMMIFLFAVTSLESQEKKEEGKIKKFEKKVINLLM